MTSQRVDVQYWDGSAYRTVASMLYPGSDVTVSSVSFAAVTTDRLRFFQPANQGHPAYSAVMWLTEIDYGFSSAPPPPPPDTTPPTVSISAPANGVIRLAVGPLDSLRGFPFDAPAISVRGVMERARPARERPQR